MSKQTLAAAAAAKPPPAKLPPGQAAQALLSLLPRPTFRLVVGDLGSSLRVTIPKGAMFHGLSEGFVSGSLTVFSRPSSRKVAKFAPLRDYFSMDDKGGEMVLAASSPCAIHLIDVKGTMRVRPSAIMACEATVELKSTSWISKKWVQVSGHGKLALFASGSIIDLGGDKRTEQIACSRLLAYISDNKISVGSDEKLFKPGSHCQAWVTLGRHGPLAPQLRPAPTPTSSISWRAWRSTTLQIFMVGLLALLVLLFSDSIESSMSGWSSMDSQAWAQWISEYMAQQGFT